MAGGRHNRSQRLYNDDVTGGAFTAFCDERPKDGFVISCEELMVEFGNYLEGDLAADVRRQLESHLAHCRTCQVLYDSTRKTLKIVTESGPFDLPATAAKLTSDKIMARIRKISRA